MLSYAAITTCKTNIITGSSCLLKFNAYACFLQALPLFQAYLYELAVRKPLLSANRHRFPSWSCLRSILVSRSGSWICQQVQSVDWKTTTLVEKWTAQKNLWPTAWRELHESHVYLCKRNFQRRRLCFDSMDSPKSLHWLKICPSI